MTLLQISDINHNYPGKKIGLGGVSLRVEPGDIGCLMGPSGSEDHRIIMYRRTRAHHRRTNFVGQATTQRT